MKKLMTALSLFIAGTAAIAQLQAPQLNSPADQAGIVDVNVKLKWYPALGGLVYGYEVEVAKDTNFTNPLSNFQITGTSARTSELEFGTMYYWRVRAKGAGSAVSQWSNRRSFTTFLDQFKNLLPTGPDKNPELNITWDTIPGVTTYEYQVSVDSNFSTSFGNSVSHPTKTALLTQLKFNTTYYYRVRASHGVDVSDWSARKSFSTRSAVSLSTPANAAVNQMPSTDLVCVNSPGINSFHFQIDDSPAFDTSSSGYRSTTIQNNEFPGGPVKWRVSRLDFNSTYYWRVQGQNNSGLSAWSEVRSFTTLSKVTLTSPADGTNDVPSSTELKWQMVTGAEKYLIEVDTDAGFTAPTVYTTNSDTSNHLIFNTKIYGTPIHWRVRALHIKDTSDFSDAFSFSTRPVGIEENIDLDFTMMPNPVEDVLSIRFKSASEDGVKLGFYNSLGSLVMEKAIPSSSKGENKMEIDVSDLNPGVYILMLDQGQMRRSQKLIVR